MKHSIEQRLIDARPGDRTSNSLFVSRTMEAIRAASTSETFSYALRTTNVTKRERLIMKLRQLPKAVSVSLAILLALLVSGAAYAAYQLWVSPTARVEVINRLNGHDEILLKLKNCQQLGNETNISIAPHSGLTAQEGALAIQAFCETSTIQSWAINDLHVESSDVLLAYTVKAIHGSSIEISDNNTYRTIRVSNATQYIEDGSYGSLKQILPGDSIAYVATTSNSPAIAVVRLSTPAKYYGTAIQNDIVLNEPCQNNPNEVCLGGGGVSDVSIFNGSNAAMSDDVYGQIQGRLTSLTATSFTLRATSGESYTVMAGTDVITPFNTQSDTNDYGVKIAVGDMLEVDYYQSSSARSNVITSDQINDIGLIVTGNAKTGPLWAY